MKFFIAFAMIVAVASAGVARGSNFNFIDENVHQIGQIIAAIESPSTDPATAQLLEQMLLEMLGQSGQIPVAVGPAIVEGISPVSVIEGPSPISVGPAIIGGISPVAPSPVSVIEGPSPISVGPAIVEGISPIAPAPVVEVPAPVAEVPAPAPAAPAQSSSLVQIIVNVNAEAAPGVQPVTVNQPEQVVPGAVAELEQVPVLNRPTPVAVFERPKPIVPAPVIPVVVSPIQIAEPVLPVVVSPVQVAEPNLPIGVQPVALPGQLN